MDPPTCNQCNENVVNDGIQCDGQCSKYYHYQCVKISKNKYKKMIFETGSWRCYNCSFGNANNLIEREIKDSLQYIIHKLQTFEPMKNIVTNHEERLRAVEQSRAELNKEESKKEATDVDVEKKAPQEIVVQNIPEVPINIKINLEVNCQRQQHTATTSIGATHQEKTGTQLGTISSITSNANFNQNSELENNTDSQIGTSFLENNIKQNHVFSTFSDISEIACISQDIENHTPKYNAEIPVVLDSDCHSDNIQCNVTAEIHTSADSENFPEMHANSHSDIIPEFQQLNIENIHTKEIQNHLPYETVTNILPNSETQSNIIPLNSKRSNSNQDLTTDSLLTNAGVSSQNNNTVDNSVDNNIKSLPIVSTNLVENLAQKITKIDQEKTQTRAVIPTKTKGTQTNIKLKDRETQTSTSNDKTFSNKQPEAKGSGNSQPVTVKVNASGVKISTKLTKLPTKTELKKHFPLVWNRQSDKHNINIVQFKLNGEDPEYIVVANKFKESLPDCVIKGIYRIENPPAYLMYLLKMEEIKKLYNITSKVAEFKLFHGTKNCNIDLIMRNNFNWRLCKQGKYGKGVSFASNASYSLAYTENSTTDNNYVFLSRVLAVKFCEGKSKLKIPLDLADTAISVGGNMPDVYVKFDDHCFYPEYLIRFKISA